MSAASVWAVKPKQYKNLSDIQSETLVAELVAQETGNSDDRFFMAQSTETVAPTPATAAATVATPEPSEDADLAVALALQQQYDYEVALFEAESVARAKLPRFSKVVCESHLPTRIIDASIPLSELEEERADAEQLREQQQQQQHPHRSHVASDSGATGTSAVVWRSKHDADICGARNAEQLSVHHPQQNLGDLSHTKLSNPVFNSLMQHAERSQNRGVRVHKLDVSTRDQVIDSRTRIMLQGFLNADIFSCVNGAISTGKEAVVFHAENADGAEFAVKIFKTTLNEFKNRQEYVEGEHRFRHVPLKQNPRRLIRLWAEKELRNLKRIERVGLRCAKAVLLKRHILVTEFIGKNGVAAPKLRDAVLSTAQLLSAFQQMALMTRAMFQQCLLVHCDWSEYNVLWFEENLYIIDLAQGVDISHTHALRFLQRDCLRVCEFFRNRHLSGVPSSRQLFEFVTSKNELGADYLQSMMAEAAAVSTSNREAENDAVWFASFIPQSLNELPDVFAAASLDSRDVFYSGLLRSDAMDSLLEEGLSEDADSDDDGSDGDASDHDNDGSDGDDADVVVDRDAPLVADGGPHRSRSMPSTAELKHQRKEAKKVTKAAQRQRRAEKSKN